MIASVHFQTFCSVNYSCFQRFILTPVLSQGCLISWVTKVHNNTFRLNRRRYFPPPQKKKIAPFSSLWAMFLHTISFKRGLQFNTAFGYAFRIVLTESCAMINEKKMVPERLRVVSRRGAIQIHVYLYLYLYLCASCTHTSNCPLVAWLLYRNIRALLSTDTLLVVTQSSRSHCGWNPRLLGEIHCLGCTR